MTIANGTETIFGFQDADTVLDSLYRFIPCTKGKTITTMINKRLSGCADRLKCRISPPIANKMNEHTFLKLVLRYSLVYPIVFGIKGILPVIDVILGIKKEVKTNHAG